jgi:hypothetical protein
MRGYLRDSFYPTFLYNNVHTLYAASKVYGSKSFGIETNSRCHSLGQFSTNEIAGELEYSGETQMQWHPYT